MSTAVHSEEENATKGFSLGSEDQFYKPFTLQGTSRGQTLKNTMVRKPSAKVKQGAVIRIVSIWKVKAHIQLGTIRGL